VAGPGCRRLSFLAIVLQIISRIFFPHLAPPGFTMTFVFFMFLGGIQLLCLGIIGSYLAHIYDEVKRRPPYIVESILNAPKEKGADNTSPPERPAGSG
jgi:dolichol-phosphate mannosyltransferase